MNDKTLDSLIEKIEMMENVFETKIESIVNDFNSIIEEQNKINDKLRKEIDSLKKEKKEKNIIVGSNDDIITITTRRENGTGNISMSKRVEIKAEETDEGAYVRTYFMLLQALSKTLG